MKDLELEIDSLAAKTPLSAALDRRLFLQAALGSGFAAAVLPVCAQTVIKTDTEGLEAGEVMLTVGGQPVPVYRAQPKGKTKLPVVLVVSEIFGVHEHIADVARRFAKLGYLALAPNLFVRQGNPAGYSAIAEVMREVVSKVPDQQVLGDLDACAAWAAANGGDAGKLGITGFCWGGRVTWLYCAHNPKVRAGVAWYGRLTGEKTALAPAHPLDIAAELKVPVLGLYGGKDNGIPLESVDKMREALARGKSRSEIMVYPDAGHAFHADYRPSYVAASARDGWQRCLAWFKAHGVA